MWITSSCLYFVQLIAEIIVNARKYYSKSYCFEIFFVILHLK